MDWLNKFVWLLLNPISIGLCALILAIFVKKLRVPLIVLALAWFYLLGTRLGMYFTGAALERPYLTEGRMQPAEAYANADAIVDFGGGVNHNLSISPYAELAQAADRVYFAAKLWKAGKAPVVIVSGKDTRLSDAEFLKDLGLPEAAVLVENEALNTEENAKNTLALLKKLNPAGTRPKILLVTSAWHMRRSAYMMAKYAPEVEVVPAPCDFESTMQTAGGFEWKWLKPDPQVFTMNAGSLHEIIGYWGYRLLR